MVKNMSKLTLDSVEWRSFRIKDVFEVKRGKRHIEKNREIGEIPYYSASSLNNGVTDFISNPLFIDRNKLLVSTFCDAFFAPKEFTASDEMTILGNEYMNERSALFISRCIKSNSTKYAFGRKAFSERIKEQIILLPIDSDDSPNWKFMEDYIKQEMKKQSHKVINYYENKLMKLGFKLYDLDVEWKEFWMEDILDIESGVRLTKADQIDGNIPFIGASDANNGVTEFVENTNKSLDSNVLGVNYNGSVVENFYHSYECIFSDDVKRIKFKNREYGDEFTYLFLKQMILSQKNKYQYGYKFNAKRMSRQKIMLPIDENGEPHWKYMSNFVKKLEKENIKKTLNRIYIYNG